MNKLVEDIIREIGTEECIAALDAPEFTEEEEALLARTAPNTAKLSLGQLQGYEKSYRPGGAFDHCRTRQDDISYEAIRRELVLRGEYEIARGF